MKRYALVVSLALLFAAFMWSCQQQDPAPLSPEGSITLGKGKPDPKPAIKYTIEVFFGDNPIPFVSRVDAVASSNGTLVGKHFPNEGTIPLTLISDKWTLFDGCIDSLEISDTFEGQLRVIEYVEEQALGNFTGENDQGFSLLIEMVGIIDGDGGWVLPGVGEALVVTGGKVHFRFEDDGKGKNKEKCGEDTFSQPDQPWRIVITRT